MFHIRAIAAKLYTFHEFCLPGEGLIVTPPIARCCFKTISVKRSSCVGIFANNSNYYSESK